jgi:general stress protein YciG
MPPSKKQVISQYMSSLGKKGGRTKGPSKARDPEKMRQAALKGWEKRRQDKKEDARET